MFIKGVIQFLLWIWFLGCVISWKFGKIKLVDGVGIKSAEFFMLCLYSAGLISFYCFPAVGKWILFGVLLFWFVVQFFCHWYFTIFGASESKLKGYNSCFEGTVKVFPVSETRLIPDLYHIVLHLMILTNIVACFVK